MKRDMRVISRVRTMVPVSIYRCCRDWPMLRAPVPRPPLCGYCGKLPVMVLQDGECEVAL